MFTKNQNKKEDRKIHPIIWSILGGTILTFLKWLLSKFISFDLTPYTPYLLIFIIGVLLMIVFFQNKLIQEGQNTRDEISKHDLTFKKVLSELSSRLTLVSWTSNLEEHDTNVFEKMSELLDDSSITGMDVFTIFRQEDIPKKKSKKAVENYYGVIQNVIKARGFRYRRAVVVREELTNQKKTKIKSSLFNNRSEFNRHWEYVHNNFNKGKAEIKAFFDEGRVIDIAFALFYEGNVQDRDISTLVLEISVWSIEKSDHIMGLLVIERPNLELINAFHGAFVGLFEEKLTVKGYSYDEIWA